MVRKPSSGFLKKHFVIASGLILFGICVLAQIRGVITLYAAPLEKSEENKTLEAASGGHSLYDIDYSLWSPARIKAYKESMAKPGIPPLAILKIPKLRIVAPVLEGTDDLTLNSGVGRIIGTAHLGEPGNVGIAGHRDSFFRGLKNIARGDKIELVTSSHKDIYVVDKIYITKPTDVNALRSGATPEITLVTCYPFYYVGNAPQRYIVQAFKQTQRATTKKRAKSLARN